MSSSRTSCFLPADVPDFVGRADELGALLSMRRRSTTRVLVCAVEGMAGIGKTALAVHAAHLLAEHYPDGQLFVDLHGYSEGYLPVEPSDALGALLTSLGVPGERIPDTLDERTALWRSSLAGARVLVVVDNAADAEHVLPLVPHGPGSLLIVTSRRRLHGLDSVYAIELDVLSEQAALALFERAAGDRRARAEPGAATEVVRLCGQLPVAVRIAAARLRQHPDWTVAQLAEQLGDEHGRLALAEGPLAGSSGRAGARVDAEPDSPGRSVAASFALSQRQLSPLARRLFALLGLVPGPDMDDFVAAALAGVTGTTSMVDVRHAMDDLLDAHLLLQRRPGRYTFHDLLRQHARRTAAEELPPEELRAATGRLLDYYLHTTASAADEIKFNRRAGAVDVLTPPVHAPIFNGAAEAVDWLLAERVNLMTAINHAAHHGWPTHAWQLAHAMWWFFHLRGYTADLVATQSVALQAVHAVGDEVGEATVLTNLGGAFAQSGLPSEAVPLLERALGLHRALDDRLSEAAALLNLAGAYFRLGHNTSAIASGYQAREVYRALGDLWGEVTALNNVGIAYNQAGDPSSAMTRLSEALAIREKLGRAPGLARVLSNYGWSLALLGRYTEALANLREALALNRQSGSRWDEGSILSEMGVTYARLGDFAEAFRCHQQALTMIKPMAQRGIEGELRNKAGESYLLAGQPEAALDHFQRALALAGQAGERYQQARALDGIAQCQRALGRPSEARSHWQQALVILKELDHRDADTIQASLDTI